MTRHHLTDTELLALHFDTRRDGDANDHVSACATCQSRGRAVTELLDRVSHDTASETDTVFGADLLARQHARIMARVAQECRSARIISFPAAAQAIENRTRRQQSSNARSTPRRFAGEFLRWRTMDVPHSRRITAARSASSRDCPAGE